MKIDLEGWHKSFIYNEEFYFKVIKTIVKRIFPKIRKLSRR